MKRESFPSSLAQLIFSDIMRAADFIQNGFTIRGRHLLGILRTSDMSDQVARLSFLDNDHLLEHLEVNIPLGAHQVLFSYLLPWRLFDGQLHRLTISMDGREKPLGRQLFVGDPAILECIWNMQQAANAELAWDANKPG